MSKSKLTLSFVLNSVYFYVNSEATYFAKKADGDTRMTRISRAAFESAQAQFESVRARSELEFRLYELRFDMDCEDLWAEIKALSDEEIRALIADYESEAAEEMPTIDPASSTKAETVPASDPTPATVAPVDVVSDPIIDGTTRPDWAEMQTFERVTMEDLRAVPGIVARGLGIACMATLKFAAMGIGALAGLGLMGLRKAMAR